MTTKSRCFCGDPVKAAGMCVTHYQYMYYWNKKGVAATMEHRDKLVSRAALLDSVRPANVVSIKRKRA